MKYLALKIPGNDGTSIEIEAPSGIPTGGLSGDGGKIIGNSIALFLIVVVLLTFGFLIYGGINWIMSGGDKTKLESARRTIIYAIIGLIVAFLSFFFVNLFGSAFGVDLLKTSI